MSVIVEQQCRTIELGPQAQTGSSYWFTHVLEITQHQQSSKSSALISLSLGLHDLKKSIN